MLALDKENNPTTTIHTNILLENFFTTNINLANNNNLVGDIDDFSNMSHTNNNNNNNNQCTNSSSSQENLMMDSLTTCTGSCDQLICNSNENMAGERQQYLDNGE